MLYRCDAEARALGVLGESLSASGATACWPSGPTTRPMRSWPSEARWRKACPVVRYVVASLHAREIEIVDRGVD